MFTAEHLDKLFVCLGVPRDTNPRTTERVSGFHLNLSFPFPTEMFVDFHIKFLGFKAVLFQIGADRFSRCDLLTLFIARKCLTLYLPELINFILVDRKNNSFEINKHTVLKCFPASFSYTIHTLFQIDI